MNLVFYPLDQAFARKKITFFLRFNFLIRDGLLRRGQWVTDFRMKAENVKIHKDLQKREDQNKCDVIYGRPLSIKALRNWKISVKAIAKRLRKLMIKTKRLSRLKL